LTEQTDNLKWVQLLLAWFDHGNRRMPWRNTKDPYKRWISEIMLQQTKVDTVIPYFIRFMERFPDVSSLAIAEEDEVLKLWEGLGYYSRARNLLKAALMIQEKHGGRFPETEKEAMKLPGVGAYSAAAVLSMAYDVPLPSVDGNVMRVYSRIYEREENILDPSVMKQVRKELEQVIPCDRPGDFNESMMELGAVICLPGIPDCQRCPLEVSCQTRRKGRQSEIPVRIKKGKKTILEQHVYVLWSEKKDAVLLRKNPSKGLLGGLWAFPTETVEAWKNREVELVQEKEIGYNVEKVGVEKHVFSHQQWNMTIFEAQANKREWLEYQWVPLSDLSKLAFPEAYRKVLRKIPKLAEIAGKE